MPRVRERIRGGAAHLSRSARLVAAASSSVLGRLFTAEVRREVIPEARTGISDDT